MFCFIVTALGAQPAGFSSGWIALPSLLLGTCLYQDCYRACKTSTALIFLAGPGDSNSDPADRGKADGTKAQGREDHKASETLQGQSCTRSEVRDTSVHILAGPHSSAIGLLNISTHVGASVTLLIQWGCRRGGNKLALVENLLCAWHGDGCSAFL